MKEVQDWYNENVPKEELIYAGAMTAQFIWVRDTLAGMIYYSCRDINSDFTDWQLRKQYLTVESTHRSKSCLLPVYKFTLGDMTIKVRGNFYDWCVKVSNTKMTIDDFPDWIKEHFSKGYYEGMERDKADLEFCIGDKERLYAILWWMLNEMNTRMLHKAAKIREDGFKTVRKTYNDFVGIKIQYVIDPYRFDSPCEALRYRLEYYIRKELEYYSGLICDFEEIKTEISAGMIIVSGTVTMCEVNSG